MMKYPEFDPLVFRMLAYKGFLIKLLAVIVLIPLFVIDMVYIISHRLEHILPLEKE
jgi:hypothetical protein